MRSQREQQQQSGSSIALLLLQLQLLLLLLLPLLTNTRGFPSFSDNKFSFSWLLLLLLHLSIASCFATLPHMPHSCAAQQFGRLRSLSQCGSATTAAPDPASVSATLQLQLLTSFPKWKFFAVVLGARFVALRLSCLSFSLCLFLVCQQIAIKQK